MDVKEKLSQFKSFWMSLPEFVCRDENVAARADEMTCWGGEKQGGYANNVNTQSSEGYLTPHSSHVSRLALCFPIRNVSDIFGEESDIDFPAMVSTLKHAYNGYQSHFDDSSKTLRVHFVRELLPKWPQL